MFNHRHVTHWVGLIVLLTLLVFTPNKPASFASEPISIVDALGRTVTFEQLPERIVIAGKAVFMITDALYLFPEARQRVVAMPGSAVQFSSSFLSLIDPAFSTDKTFLEGQVGPEQIAPTQPDVVLMKSYMKGSLGDPLEQLGIPVVYVELEVPERYASDLNILGQLVGNPGRAQEINAFVQEHMDRVQAGLQGLDEANKPKVLVLYYTTPGGTTAFSVAPASWMQTKLVELAGGVPLWTDAAQGSGWTVVNFEQVAAWNPDQVFILHYSGDSQAVVDSLKSDPAWSALKAVQEGKIYGFPADYYSWDQPDPRWILGLTWLAGKLHPDRFADVDMMQEVDTFFEQMYGLSADVVQTQIIPLLKGSLP